MDKQTEKTSWFDELWPRVAIASGIGYAATAYAVSRWLTRRSPALVELPTHLSHCAIETLTCTTLDGLVLKGWCIEPAFARGTVALFHGMRLNRASTLDRIAFLTAAGYRCIAFDHRAHGESGGRTCTFGYLEGRDVIAVLGLIRKRWPGAPCAALGTSMGAAAVCFAGSAARGFDALVLESVYADLARAFQHRVGCGYPAWFRHFRRGIVWITERRLGMSINDVSPRAYIPSLAPRPVLLLTGSDDLHAPPEEMRTLAEQIPAFARFHVIPGAGHGDVCTHGGPVYRDLLLGFLERHLLASRVSAAA